LLDLRRNWGENRVYYYVQNDDLASVPLSWTNLESVDPFKIISAGRAHFRIEDLIEMSKLIQQLLLLEPKLRNAKK
jgi:hypothetical protein